MDLRGIITGFTKSISQELDFRLEGRNLKRFAHLHESNPLVVFPRPYDALSTSEVLCMEYLEGRKFSDLIDAGDDPAPLVDVYFNVAYKMLFTDGFFHGDLHPGNVLVMEGSKLGVLDCGMVGRLSPSMRDKIIDIVYAILVEDLEAVARTFYDLSIRTDQVDYDRFEADVIEIGERYLVGLPLSEVQLGTLFAEIVGGATRHKVRMPTDFTMLFKAVLTTEGLAKSIAPDRDPIELARPFIMEMVADRYNPERLKRLFLSDFNQLSRLARKLPHALPAFLQDVRGGRLALRISDETLARQREIGDARVRTLVATALTVTSLACGTYTLGLGLPVWPAVGIPAVSAMFFFAAGVGLFALLVL
jgi:ubiquinone biosynthesis protein